MAQQKIIPHLWFDTQAKQAAEFYAATFPNATITNLTTLNDTPSGSAELVGFNIDGYQFMAISAGPYFKINPSISFTLRFDPREDPLAATNLDAIWEKLSAGGTERMPLAEYPFSPRFGWIEDQFGVNWQLTLATTDAPERPFITPSLLFVSDACQAAEEATELYLSLFNGSQRGALSRYPAGMLPNKEGSIMFTEFQLAGQWFSAMDGSSAMHPFKFNEAISFIVNCADQAEIDHYWNALSADPAAEQCGWLKDKFGVSWQIVPADMERHMSGEPEKVARATQALMGMKKLVISEIEKAYQGE